MIDALSNLLERLLARGEKLDREEFEADICNLVDANEDRIRAVFPNGDYEGVLRQIIAEVDVCGHGRDGCCQPPPVQIPACAANAPGSSLGFWRRSGDMAVGVVS
jgi:hypothetical protein